MMNIENYLADGANWQARAVLACLQSRVFQFNDFFWSLNRERKEKEETPIYYRTAIGRYENCREQGYVFTFQIGGNARHYAVYEHRNSDYICVLIADGLYGDTPNVDFMWKPKGENATKYDYDKGFSCGEVLKCANFIIEDVLEWAEKVINETRDGTIY